MKVTKVKRSKVWKVLKVVLVIIFVYCILGILWSLFYFLTGFLYHHFNMNPSPWLRQLVNAGLGVFIFGVIMSIIGHFIGGPKRMTYFQAIIEAMRQIAKGNFKIELNELEELHHHHDKSDPFVQLIDSVHYMANELDQMERLRQEFISNVSHEIQSPLTSIKGFALALKNDNLPKDKRDHYLQIIETESDRLSKLSDNLLKLTALENERHPVYVSTYRLDEQIRQILLFFEPQWKNKSIQMRIDLDKINVTADGDLMNQVWTNLIQNSIKFTPEHGVITVTLKGNESQAVFSITDTGIGIKEADRQHLFERFYKADRSRNRALGGNGLGLSIVKKIVDLHNGEISVKSEYGKGTTMTVKLAPALVDKQKLRYHKA